MQQRTLLTTLIALVDTGVDTSNTTDSPYYDLADAYDAYNKVSYQTAGDPAVQGPYERSPPAMMPSS
jgi:hypothetical protein